MEYPTPRKNMEAKDAAVMARGFLITGSPRARLNSTQMTQMGWIHKIKRIL
jgi:hypothetical protein